jgi:hypothetical protein
MTKLECLARQTVCAAFVLCSGVALAQESCQAGRAANGQCVDPGLFNDLRQTEMIFSQPRISETHYPVLPSNDWTLRYPNQLTTNPLQTGVPGAAPSRTR